jgi:hypothetical protein
LCYILSRNLPAQIPEFLSAT